MSYDLAVYLPEALNLDALTAIVRQLSGLDVNSSSPDTAKPFMLTVVRGQRREYCFTIDGPTIVEPEDVPEEVTAALLGAKYLYEISVEGSSATSIPIAARFAKRLAREAAGALFDAQSGQAWPTSSARKLERPAKGTMTDTVYLQWYMLTGDMPVDLPQLYLNLARKYLPEALPRRFGTTEPFQGNLERDGDQGFVQAYESQPEDMLFMYCTYPIPYGYILGRSMHSRGDVRSVKLEMDRSVLADPRWRDAARAFFIEFADHSKCFFASAEVLKEHSWDGRTFRSGARGEKPGPLQDRGQWGGLPDYPQWWTWYSPLYIDLVQPYLTGSVEKRPQGVFHSWTSEPADREEIKQLLKPPATSWTSRSLSPTYDANGRIQSPAHTLPEQLTQA